MTEVSKSTVDQADFPDRADPVLIADYVLKTIIPKEQTRIGYAVMEKILYFVTERFRQVASPHVREILQTLKEQGLIAEAPFPNCWKLVESGSPHPRSR